MADLTPETHPVINSPYSEPVRHWQLDKDGRALPTLLENRRASASRTMVPQARKAQSQAALFYEEQYHEFINEVRNKVREWRRAGHPNLSRVSRDLLTHWRSATDQDGPVQRLFFAQVEALETLMWLYESPAKISQPYRHRLDTENADHNEGCNRLAVRMATGTGKTTVMAMLIAWHTVLYRRGSKKQKAQHAQTFVIITPGLTVKDRLQELDPKRAGNIYTAQNLLPRKYRQDIQQACIRIINFQAFRQRDLLEGAAADQKKMIAKAKLRRGQPTEQSQEDYHSMLARVMNLPSGPQHHRIVVLNDEAHHCYGQVPEAAKLSKPKGKTDREVFSRTKKEEAEEIQRAKQWFGILTGLHKQKRLLVAHDLSATPYYVSHQWIRFPWILSDYDLHEAMEAGLVKIPRVPVDDDAAADDVVFRELYKHTEPKALKREAMHSLVNQAMQSLYNSYEQRLADWKQADHERLPVLIVVANEIKNATALYDWIAGYQTDEGWVSGAFALLSNVSEERQRKDRPVTMVVHSDRLEDSEAEAKLTGTGSDRMVLVAEETALSRGEEEQADSKKKQAEYLRRILSTVGKDNQPGEHIRCVVSVGMLTEGWDARTVTHILGFRAFESPLLCEQVAGRALRRVNYQSMTEFAGEQVLTAEYSEILGIPFRFSDAQGKEPPGPPEKTIEVLTQPNCETHRISWPQVEMYRRRIESGRIRLNPDKVQPFDATSTYDEPTISELAGIIGEMELLDSPEQRRQRVYFEFARSALQRLSSAEDSQGDSPDSVPPPPPLHPL